MSEEITKGLVKKRLIDVGYPINQDENVNGIICYKEDSYNNGLNMDKKLAVAFLNASKRNSGNKGRRLKDKPKISKSVKKPYNTRNF